MTQEQYEIIERAFFELGRLGGNRIFANAHDNKYRASWEEINTILQDYNSDAVLDIIDPNQYGGF